MSLFVRNLISQPRFKMSEVKNIPRLRFKDDTVKDFSDWKEMRLGEVVNLKHGYQFRRTDFTQEGLPIIKIGNVKGTGLFLEDLSFIDENRYEEFRSFEILNGDILMSLTGNIGRVVEVKNLPYKVIQNYRVGNFQPFDENEISKKFLKHLLATDQVFGRFNSLSNQSAQANFGKQDMDKIKVCIPNLEEQQKIADFLTAVDKRIELLEKKKILLETYKKGVMKKIFDQEIRFKDDQGKDFPDWDNYKLSQVLFEHKEKNTKSKLDEVFSVSKHKGVVNQIEHLGRSYSAESIDHYKLINNWDIVYTKSPTSDFPFGIIKQNTTGRTGVLSPLYGVFRPKNKWIGKMIASYFESWINTYNYLNPLVQKGAKNTMNINNDTFLDGKHISLPTSEEEQEKISQFLFSIEHQIELLETQFDKSKTWKKGLLQKMFV